MDATPGPSAWVVVKEEPDRVVLRIHGELDAESCPPILPTIVTAMPPHPPSPSISPN